MEERGLVTSEWSEDLPGPAKRTYEITAEGRRALERWALWLREARDRIDTLIERLEEGEVNMHGHGHHRHRRGWGPRLGARFYERERVLERLEEYQRDLEQELADVADLIRRLKDEQTQTTPTV